MTLALSIRQPWAWAIIHAGKDIENRDWITRVRGRILIHASSRFDCPKDEALFDCEIWARRACIDAPTLADIHAGGIVGEAEIVDCVSRSESPWFVGRYGFVLRNPRPLPFRPLKGRLGFFDVDEAALYGEPRQ